MKKFVAATILATSLSNPAVAEGADPYDNIRDLPPVTAGLVIAGVAVLIVLAASR